MKDYRITGSFALFFAFMFLVFYLDSALAKDSTLTINKIHASNSSMVLEGAGKAEFSIEDIKLNLQEKGGEFVIEVKNLPFAEVVRLAQVDELIVDGSLSGKIPVVLKNDGIFIKGAKLKSNSAGKIKYKSGAGLIPDVGDNNLAFINSILKNFSYKSIELSIDGNLKENQKIKFTLNGNNPDVYEGKEVQFNINLEGNIAKLIQSSLDTYNLPEKLLETLQNEKN